MEGIRVDAGRKRYVRKRRRHAVKKAGIMAGTEVGQADRHTCIHGIIKESRKAGKEPGICTVCFVDGRR